MTLEVPQDPDAEAMTVGCCLFSDRQYLKAAELLKPDDFYSPVYRRLFQACGQLGHLTGTDLSTRNIRIDQVAELAGEPVEFVWAIYELDGPNVGEYARRVLEKATLRRAATKAIDLLADLPARLASGDPVAFSVVNQLAGASA